MSISGCHPSAVTTVQASAALPVAGHAHRLDFLFCQRSLGGLEHVIYCLQPGFLVAVVRRVMREGAHSMLNLRLSVRKN